MLALELTVNGLIRSMRRLWPGLVSALANSRSSRTVSVTSSASDQLNSGDSNQRIVSRTVEGTTPTPRLSEPEEAA